MARIEPITAETIYESLQAYIETKEGSDKLDAMSDEELVNEFKHWYEEKGCSYFKSCWIIGNRLDGNDADENDYYEE